MVFCGFLKHNNMITPYQVRNKSGVAKIVRMCRLQVPGADHSKPNLSRKPLITVWSHWVIALNIYILLFHEFLSSTPVSDLVVTKGGRTPG